MTSSVRKLALKVIYEDEGVLDLNIDLGKLGIHNGYREDLSKEVSKLLNMIMKILNEAEL